MLKLPILVSFSSGVKIDPFQSFWVLYPGYFSFGVCEMVSSPQHLLTKEYLRNLHLKNHPPKKTPNRQPLTVNSLKKTAKSLNHPSNHNHKTHRFISKHRSSTKRQGSPVWWLFPSISCNVPWNGVHGVGLMDFRCLFSMGFSVVKNSTEHRAFGRFFKRLGVWAFLF